MKTNSTLLILLFGALFAKGQTGNYKILNSDTLFAILQVDTSSYCSKKLDRYNQGVFTNNDLLIVDSILNVFVTEHTNRTRPFLCGFQIHDYQYYYQIISLKDSNDEKVIWINAFAPIIMKLNSLEPSKYEKRLIRKGKLEYMPFNWRKDIICGNDGCGVFWELKIKVSDKSIFDIIIGGV